MALALYGQPDALSDVDAPPVDERSSYPGGQCPELEVRMQCGGASTAFARRDGAVVFMRHDKEEQRSERHRGRFSWYANF